MNPIRPRGAAAVGRLSDLDPLEAGAVMYLRLWGDGPSGRSDAASDFDIALGSRRGRAAMQALDELCALCAAHSRRPLMHHGLNCSCLGADENCFAQMVASAAEGAREDAMMMASLIVRPDFVPALASLSEQFGLLLCQMTAQTPVPRCGSHNAPVVIH